MNNLYIRITVNYPRLNTFEDEPIEAMICEQTKQGVIVLHNVFGVTGEKAAQKAEIWLSENGYESASRVYDKAIELYDAAFNNGWRLGKRPVSRDTAQV